MDHSFGLQVLDIFFLQQLVADSAAHSGALGLEFFGIDGASVVGVEVKVPRLRLAVLQLEESHG